MRYLLPTNADYLASDCAWVLTHLDDADIKEGWSFPAKKEDVRYYLKKAKFPEVWSRVLELTPEERMVDYVSYLPSLHRSVL